MDAAWIWRALPAMDAGRYACCACVMSDGRFAVLGGWINGARASFEALLIGDGEHWQTLPPMHDSRSYFACVAVAGCVIVAGGIGRRTVRYTKRCSIGGCGFHVTYLILAGCGRWAAHFYGPSKHPHTFIACMPTVLMGC
jgi:hypothetical protein